MKKSYLIQLFLVLFTMQVFAQGQQDYSSNAKLTERISTLVKAYPQLVKSTSIAQTVGGKNIWMLTVGTNKTEEKQAIAVVGGVEGKHLLGVELAMGFAEKLCALSTADSIKTLLSKHTFYVFPNMSPDATEQYFAKVKYERLGNANATDDDRDGKNGEDGFDDLNGDGKISWMRIVDPTGTYKLNPDDNRSLILADPTKGEVGKYILLSEGIDNDKDGKFNEDGEGGVSFNRNLSYNYKNFVPGAGEYAVSEKETRALLDWMFDAFNIYTVVTFGPTNNLSTPQQVNPAGLSKRIITSWYDQDAKANALVSEKYNKITNLKDAPKTQVESGDFSQWAYFHYGRLSFSTPGWWVPKVKPDTAKKQRALTTEDPVANYLRWADAQGITNTFTEWKTYNHPDFQGQTVEVGGIDPFVLTNPPYKMVDDLVKKHTSFLITLANMAPSIEITNVKTEKLGDGLTRVSLNVKNNGLLPTHTKVGEGSYFTKLVQVKVQTVTGQSFLSGNKTQSLKPIAGQGYTSLTWLIKGNGKISISAGSPNTGTQSIDLTL